MLIDDLKAFASTRPHLKEDLDSLSDPNLICIDAKNICDYASNLKWEDNESYSVYLGRHCFDLHMPGGRTWVEAKPLKNLKGLINRVGCLFESSPRSDEFLQGLPPVAEYKDGQKVLIRDAIVEANHVLSITFYVSTAQGMTRLPYESLVLLDSASAPIKIGGRGFALTIVTDWDDIHRSLPDTSDEDATLMAGNEAYDLMAVPLVACTLLNVKNVVLRSHVPDERLQRKRIKNGKMPLVKVYTLEVETPGKRMVGNPVTMPKNVPSTSSRPLHLVRGHLADYRDGKGLFGKYKGVYWMPAHFRGSDENGVIKKRYRVVTDKEMGRDGRTY